MSSRSNRWPLILVLIVTAGLLNVRRQTKKIFSSLFSDGSFEEQWVIHQQLFDNNQPEAIDTTLEDTKGPAKVSAATSNSTQVNLNNRSFTSNYSIVYEENNLTKDITNFEAKDPEDINDTAAVLATTNSSASAIVDQSVISSKTNSTPRLKTIIIGTVRDVAQDLLRLEKITFPRLQKELDIAYMIFFENDSNDDSFDVLQRWQTNSSLPPIHLERQFNMSGYKKEDRLAEARMILWELVRNVEKTKAVSFDYVFMMDMDEVNLHLSHVNECSTLPQNWMVCCANSYYLYYDQFAARTYDDWIPGDFWLKKDNPRENFKKRGNSYQWRHIDAYEEPIRMKSCFNGAALYKWNAMKQANLSTYYGSFMEQVQEADNTTLKKRTRICEHVPFHRSLKEQIPTGEIYIMPKMMNDGPYWIRNRKLFRSRITDKTRCVLVHINKTDPYYKTNKDWNSYPTSKPILRKLCKE